jgi:hypothetical protein
MRLSLSAKCEPFARYLRAFDAALFPAVPEYKTRKITPKDWPLLLLCALLFSAMGTLLPANGFIGFDWILFGKESLPFYPPWTKYVPFLTWPGLIGLTLTGVGLALIQRRASLPTVIMAFLSLPVMWTLFLGQLDGLALLGCVGLPWLAPLALMKPQISIFVFLSKKRYMAALVVTVVLSCLIWGLWPINMFNYRSYFAQGRFPQDISLWPWTIPVAVVLLWLSRGDEDMLMLAGSFATPHVIPYNYIVLVPAMARVGQISALLAWALSWTPFLANWVGPVGWFLGHLFPAVLWLSLYRQRYHSSISLMNGLPGRHSIQGNETHEAA